jgi:HEPN domain-containing protein
MPVPICRDGMKPITGKLSITLEPFTTAKPAPPHTYFGVAQGMMPGVKILAEASQPCALALALVAAHVVECLLKAYLSRDGSEVEKTHDLGKLWAMAVGDGLKISKSPPDWASRLGGLHNRPYHLRYSEGVHGIGLPAAEPMASELAALLENVRVQLS